MANLPYRSCALIYLNVPLVIWLSSCSAFTPGIEERQRPRLQVTRADAADTRGVREEDKSATRGAQEDASCQERARQTSEAKGPERAAAENFSGGTRRVKENKSASYEADEGGSGQEQAERNSAKQGNRPAEEGVPLAADDD